MSGWFDRFFGAARRHLPPGQRPTGRVWLVLVGIVVLHALLLLVALVWWRHH
jgi:hypothetical protein